MKGLEDLSVAALTVQNVMTNPPVAFDVFQCEPKWSTMLLGAMLLAWLKTNPLMHSKCLVVITSHKMA